MKLRSSCLSSRSKVRRNGRAGRRRAVCASGNLQQRLRRELAYQLRDYPVHLHLRLCLQPQAHTHPIRVRAQSGRQAEGVGSISPALAKQTRLYPSSAVLRRQNPQPCPHQPTLRSSRRCHRERQPPVRHAVHAPVHGRADASSRQISSFSQAIETDRSPWAACDGHALPSMCRSKYPAHSF